MHAALLDSLNSKAAIDALLDLVKDTNKYLKERQSNSQGAFLSAVNYQASHIEHESQASSRHEHEGGLPLTGCLVSHSIKWLCPS